MFGDYLLYIWCVYHYRIYAFLLPAKITDTNLFAVIIVAAYFRRRDTSLHNVSTQTGRQKHSRYGPGYLVASYNSYCKPYVSSHISYTILY